MWRRCVGAARLSWRLTARTPVAAVNSVPLGTTTPLLVFARHGRGTAGPVDGERDRSWIVRFASGSLCRWL